MGALSTLPRSAWLEPRDWPDQQKPMSLMDRLYNRLDGAYPNRWRAAFGTNAAIDNWRQAWAEAFEEEGITPQEIAEGIRACRKKYDWPPSLTEFLKACRNDQDIEALFHRAVIEMRKRRDRQQQTWPSNQLFWAAASLGNDLFAYPYRETPSQQGLASRWAAAYQAAAEQARDPIPESAPASALPAPGKTSISQEEARRRIAEAMAAIGGATRMPA